MICVGHVKAADYLGPNGPLSRSIEGYEHRPAQMEMAQAVEQTLEGDGVLLVEAGTGTGKTLAYLIPAILCGRRVVVSTGTKTLQDQIMQHDLPLLEEQMGLPVRAACMKGLTNYLCLRRFEEVTKSAAGDHGPLARHLPMLQQWRATSPTGDAAELRELGEDPELAQILSSSETRIGAKCSYFEDCFVTKMRRRAEEAQLIVVNHHLFFADLATRGPRGGGFIPDYDTVIFDEAHQIEDVVTQFFGALVSSTRIEVLVRDGQRALGAAGLGPGASAFLMQVLQTAANFFIALPRGSQGEPGRHPLPPESFSGAPLASMLALDAALDALESHCKRSAAAHEAVSQIGRRAAQIRGDIATIAEGGKGSHVTWTEARGRRGSIGASPIDVSDIVREELFYRARSVVLTSATLATKGSFDFVQRRLGINFPARTSVLPSPFDYDKQAALYLPAELPDPRDPKYMDSAAAEVVSLVNITGGGAFVLCTSHRMMRALAERARNQIVQPVLVQGDAPKSALLDRFRHAGSAVLFATASFWEGVDVPGIALRLVIIDKLPFDVPTDPLVAARCERMKERGEEPFMKYLVPAAALALKQGFGRLIRTASDRGIVAILDRRIVQKGYGKVFLKSLPPARRCNTLAEVEAFYRGRSLLSPPGSPTSSYNRCP